MEFVAKDMMSQPAITVCMEVTIRELLALLEKMKISGVPVVDGDDNLVGVISMTDLLLSHISGMKESSEVSESDFHSSPAMDGLSNAQSYLEPDESILEHPVQDLMSRNTITVSGDAHIAEICDQMISHRIHRVIVVEGAKVCGIISVTDILHAVRDRYHQV